MEFYDQDEHCKILIGTSKLIFDLYTSGKHTMDEIADWLNYEEIRTVSGRTLWNNINLARFLQKITTKPPIKFCKVCNQKFQPKSNSNVFCSKECAKAKERFETPKQYDSRLCIICNKSFQPSTSNHLMCSDQCRRVKQQEGHSKQPCNSRPCIICNELFEPNIYYQITCSDMCRDKHNQIRSKATRRRKTLLHPKQLKHTTHHRYIHDYLPEGFCGLDIKSEKDFEKWFKENHFMFGIKEIVKCNGMFPDIWAFTLNNTMIRIELEYYAPNFILHKHDPLFCDIIISYVKRKGENTIKGIPIISLFDAKGNGQGNYNPNTLELSHYTNTTQIFLDTQIKTFLERNCSYVFEI